MDITLTGLRCKQLKIYIYIGLNIYDKLQHSKVSCLYFANNFRVKTFKLIGVQYIYECLNFSSFKLVNFIISNKL